MVLTLLAIFIAMFIVGICIDCNKHIHDNGAGFIVGIIGIIGGAICLVATLCLTGGCINLKTIDSKIEMYTTENEVIEHQIDVAVREYMSYEKEIMTEASPESSITLVAAFPELAADELVKKQIDIYIDNNAKIKQLKEDKINGAAKQWWLYFGGNFNKQPLIEAKIPTVPVATG